MLPKFINHVNYQLILYESDATRSQHQFELSSSIMEQDMKTLNGEISEKTTFLDENGFAEKPKSQPAKSFRRKVVETLALYLGFIVVVSII